MKTPVPGDKVTEVVTLSHEILEVLETSHFTNHAKVRTTDGRIFLIAQKRSGETRYQVVTELADDTNNT